MIDTKPKATGFVPYRILTPELQAEARAMRPKWSLDQFDRMEFCVRHDGHLSRRFGHHQLTAEEYKAIDDMLERAQNMEPQPQKGSLNAWKPGHSFTFVHGREP